jgi:alpha-beta hydrolase superfamily lysophospholipase
MLRRPVRIRTDAISCHIFIILRLLLLWDGVRNALRHRPRWRLALAVALVGTASCHDRRTTGSLDGEARDRAAATASRGHPRRQAPDAESPAVPADPTVPVPVEVRTIDVPGDLPVFFLPSNRPKRLVFLHGACTHGLGYLQSFQFAAAARGSAIALQGEVACDGEMRRWAWKVNLTDARIAAAWRAAGDERPVEDLLLIGYSQGASIAEALVAKWPKKYTRLVSIGAPRTPAVRDARALVTMSGSLDNVETMRAGAEFATNAGVPATFILIPGARHGQMGDAEKLMKEALAFVDAH